VASPFLTPFKLALVVAVFVAMPYLLYQFWAFVAPGLYTHEKRLAVPLVSSSIVLFYLGMAFAYFVVFPLVFRFFTAVTPEGVAQMPDIAFYLEFVLKLFFAFGIAFEIPIATILLVAVGATTPKALAQKRPYVIVGVFVAGMLLTPPDVVSQTLLAIPMWLLFEAGIFFSRWFQKRQPAAPDPAPGDGPGGSGSGPAGGGQPGPGRPGSGVVVGDEIDGGDMNEPGRYRPMTEAEMDAELDAIEAEEAADAEAAEPPSEPEADGAAVPKTTEPIRIAALIRSANERRAEGDTASARSLLYLVLEEGDADQRQVARNILADLDRD
jgi:sec-independent protein translocase protein TatC